MCPCMFCCHPDTTIDRESLIREMRAASKSRTVNMAMIEDTLREDREFRKRQKFKWKRRWNLCCCCFWLLLICGSTAAVLLLALGSWSLLCYGEDCGFEARMHFGVVFTPSKKIVVLGGTNKAVNFGDVWEGNADGNGWRLLAENAPFGPRHGHALLCHPGTGELFLIAGDVQGVGEMPSKPTNDVWMSDDGGTQWYLQTASAPWLPRKYLGTAINENGVIFLAGGNIGYGMSGLNDVWKSEDGGKTWSPLTLVAPWTARHSFAFVRLSGGSRPGRLYVLGGEDGRRLHDVWASDDGGRTWSVMTFTHTREQRFSVYEERASWTPRASFPAVADKDGFLTLTAGATDEEGDASYSAEVWQLPTPADEDLEWYERKTKDDRLNTAAVPLEWSLASSPPWTGRYGHAAFIDDEGVPHIVGGEDKEGLKNDLWKMTMSFDVNNLQAIYERTKEQAMGLGLFGDGETDTADASEEASSQNGTGNGLENNTVGNGTIGNDSVGNGTIGNDSSNGSNLTGLAELVNGSGQAEIAVGNGTTDNTTNGSNATAETVDAVGVVDDV